ncbi:hypothetical protein NDU88_003205 [Pleurodeles waltl]|uniref:Uncharacterized protein n=1 Tax=Pleurodeles waltl TaxID=8319 RepID=A0AAV7MPW2_PLEWA|nr:hypothetical protein NDU88_003205 [Pleurodeles waltl]
MGAGDVCGAGAEARPRGREMAAPWRLEPPMKEKKNTSERRVRSQPHGAVRAGGPLLSGADRPYELNNKGARRDDGVASGHRSRPGREEILKEPRRGQKTEPRGRSPDTRVKRPNAAGDRPPPPLEARKQLLLPLPPPEARRQQDEKKKKGATTWTEEKQPRGAVQLGGSPSPRAIALVTIGLPRRFSCAAWAGARRHALGGVGGGI